MARRFPKKEIPETDWTWPPKDSAKCEECFIWWLLEEMRDSLCKGCHGSRVRRERRTSETVSG